MKKILMIAFQYPPFRGSSGIQRTLKFSRYLPDHGWQPIVLTANPRAYPAVGDDQLHEIPEDVPVWRAFALDTAKHFSVRGIYFNWMAFPDRWSSWFFGGIPAGLRLIRNYRPDIIWSTYPIATAHLIGLTLHRLTHIPWVADFRDLMVDNDCPQDFLTRRGYLWIEKQVAGYGSRLVFTTEGAQRMYMNRYTGLPSRQCLVIPNGYDEEDYRELSFSEPSKNPNGRPVRLVHAGLLYPFERDPTTFFKVLARLKKVNQVTATNLIVQLRASGSETHYSKFIREFGIDDLVHLLPPLPYRRALQDCADADGLLLFQGASCNHLIPAKVYEYLRLQKPILALTDNRGDTAALLREVGGATILDLTDEEALYQFLPEFMSRVRNGKHPLPDTAKVKLYTRKNQAFELAKCLSKVILQEGNI
jgi:glycosyltransferase involved in cell wall biosynthesis